MDLSVFKGNRPRAVCVDISYNLCYWIKVAMFHLGVGNYLFINISLPSFIIKICIGELISGFFRRFIQRKHGAYFDLEAASVIEVESEKCITVAFFKDSRFSFTSELLLGGRQRETYGASIVIVEFSSAYAKFGACAVIAEVNGLADSAFGKFSLAEGVGESLCWFSSCGNQVADISSRRF